MFTQYIVYFLFSGVTTKIHLLPDLSASPNDWLVENADGIKSANAPNVHDRNK